MENLEQIKVQVDNLANLRKVPQLILFENIDPSTVIKVREAIIALKDQYPDCEEIDFVILSAGGTPDDAYRIIRTLRRNFQKVNAVVPYWSKSAATLLCLGASTIIMDEFADFGPLDIQIVKERVDGPLYDHESALNDEQSLALIEIRSNMFIRSLFAELYKDKDLPIHKKDLLEIVTHFVSNFYTPLIDQINPYDLGGKKRKLEIGQKYAERILTIFHEDFSKKSKDFLVDYLVSGCPDHAFVIDDMHMEALMGKVIVSPESIGKDYKRCLNLLSIFLMKLDEDVRCVEFRHTKVTEPSLHNNNGTVLEQSNIKKVAKEIDFRNQTGTKKSNGKVKS